jgi:hypothetical protein
MVLRRGFVNPKAREYVLHHYCDTEALTAFTEIAGQQEGPAR